MEEEEDEEEEEEEEEPAPPKGKIISLYIKSSLFYFKNLFRWSKEN